MGLLPIPLAWLVCPALTNHGTELRMEASDWLLGCTYVLSFPGRLAPVKPCAESGQDVP